MPVHTRTPIRDVFAIAKPVTDKPEDDDQMEHDMTAGEQTDNESQLAFIDDEDAPDETVCRTDLTVPFVILNVAKKLSIFKNQF